MSLISLGDTIGIVASSNGLKRESETKIIELENKLNQIGLNVILSPYIYRKSSIASATGKERADALMNFFKDDRIKAIFDISGGDLANEILEYLDYRQIRNNSKPFFGYSDLSVLLNSIYAKSGIATYNYQIQNLVGKFEEKQTENFINTLLKGKNDLTSFEYKWIQGSAMEGIVIGGNVRCFLKLAGTGYMPDFEDKILLLESLGGDAYKMITYLTQYKHLGAFKKIKGIILGTFTEMEREKYSPDIIQIIKRVVDDESIPICKSSEIGHGQDAKCIRIGEKIIL
jgi:muramoyltetrapeptide carboxypeptidase LdcA involved in peptidoglycan recycling